MSMNIIWQGYHISFIDIPATTIIGTAIFDNSVTFALEEKICKLLRLGERLKSLDRHDALYLLKNCFSIPRLLYVLRTSPCISHPLLAKYDEILRRLLEYIVNTPLDEMAWLQATLPVSFGGLGIRRATDLAVPAFMSSVFSVQQSVCKVLQIENIDDVLFGTLSPSYSPPEDKSSQKAWDRLLCKRRQTELINRTPGGSKERARLLSATAPQSGSWLNALPSAALGLKLDDEQLRVAVALRIGTPICEPHHCRNCSAPVDSDGIHGLSCRLSAGRHPRHRIVNNILKQALGSAGFPAVTEPPGLCRSDGKRPDGMTLIPWLRGRALVWDFTCTDTCAASNVEASSIAPGEAAAKAFRKKADKYRDIFRNFIFVPVAMETPGAWAEESFNFIRELGRRIACRTGEPRSSAFHFQRISVAVLL